MLVQEFRGCSVQFPRKLYERPGSHFCLVNLIPRIKAERYLISMYNFEVFYKEIQKMCLRVVLTRLPCIRRINKN